jgi:hypothetical protein
MRYVILAAGGGLAGVVLAVASLPSSTSIDDAWKYVWLGLGLGAAGGTVLARAIRWWR